MNGLLLTVLTLCVLGVVLAIILYFVAQKFKVEEDPRIDVVEKMFPGSRKGSDITITCLPSSSAFWISFCAAAFAPSGTGKARAGIPRWFNTFTMPATDIK